MDFNWVDWAIVGVTALGLLFGLMWGTLRIFFFGLCVAVALALRPLTIPLTGDLLDQFVFSRLGNSNTLDIVRSALIVSLSLFVPFAVLSALLAWPHSLLVKRLNPFINFIIGATVGGALGFLAACAALTLYAHASVDQARYPAYCGSSLTPFVYDSSVALLRAAPQVTAEATELQNFLIDLTPALAQADPRTPGTCGERLI